MQECLVDATAATLTIGPFQLDVSVELVHALQFPSDPDAPTSLELLPSEPAPLPREAYDDPLASGDRFQHLFARRGALEVLRRSVRVIRSIADAIIECRPEDATPTSPIATLTAADDLVAYLLDREEGEKGAGELKTILVEMFGRGHHPRSRLPS